MSVALGQLTEMIAELPSTRQAEVRDFVEFLLTKSKPKPSRKLRQGWAGALRGYRDHYTSVELQKEALKWRTDKYI